MATKMNQHDNQNFGRLILLDFAPPSSYSKALVRDQNNIWSPKSVLETKRFVV